MRASTFEHRNDITHDIDGIYPPFIAHQLGGRKHKMPGPTAGEIRDVFAARQL